MNGGALLATVASVDPISHYGEVAKVVGLVVECAGPAGVALGELCILGDPRHSSTRAEVVGFRDDRVLLMPLGEFEGIRPGTGVFPTRASLTVPVADSLRGRVLDGLGRPMDDRGPLNALVRRPVHSTAPAPLSRRRITEPLGTGLRAIDGLVTFGKGQRMGIFSGSGVGKSTLLGMIARESAADVNVIALVGERGKEVLDFIDQSLGPEGLRRSVVVASTSDQPALIRQKAAFVATTIAEHFREQGRDVMLMMDSLTRVAMAQREIGLSAGEPPTTKGYPPSVFALLPRLLERVGSTTRGSITGIYTVLVEGDEMDEPIADASRAILDGHLVLSRRLAARVHYPPIDVNESVSRSMKDVVDPAQWDLAMEIKSLLATYGESEDLINIGAYAQGSNPQIDRALQFVEPINMFLRQRVEESGDLEANIAGLMGLLDAGPTSTAAG